jgi:hypothetical protein
MMSIQSKMVDISASSAQTSAFSAVKRKFRYVLIILLIIPPFIVNAQTEKLSESITEVAEQLASDDTDPEAVATYTDRLNELSEDPVNINSSNENELSKLFFLSDFQIKSLLDYIQKSGSIVSFFEIANIPGFDKETVMMIIPFIKLGTTSRNNHQDSSRLRHQIITNISFKPGMSDTSSLGSPIKILTKYRFTTGNISAGLTMEKDAGEKLLTGTPPLPDFLSGYISYAGGDVIKKIIAGDFSARFGQGTNINTGIRRGMSLVSPGYMSASDEIKPYASTDENRFLRGVATQLSVNNFDLFAFYSRNYSDATLSSSSGISNDYFETFYTGGTHNTVLLQNKKDVVSEIVYGLTISYNSGHFKTGFSFSRTNLSCPVKVPESDLVKIFDFQGTSNNLFSLYYNMYIKKLLCFGEMSANDKARYAIVQGFSMRPSDRLTINAIMRSYNPGFITFYGQGPGTGSKTSNQKGVLGNLTYEAAKHLFVSAGCEVIYYPWLRYRNSAPSMGSRREVMIKYTPLEILTVDASYNYSLTMNDKSEEQGIPQQAKLITRTLRTAVHYTARNNLILGMRCDYKFVNPSGSKGFMLCQDVNYSFAQIPVTIWFRYCLFDTNDWTSRIYAYENDLLYSFSIPALSGDGSRSYLMLKWKIADLAELRIKYGITSVSSELSMKNTDELKLQFRVGF